MHRTREQFTISSLLGLVRGEFNKHHHDKAGQYEIRTRDCLMSALAMFSLKYASLLQFDKDTHERALRHNLRTLYGVEPAPCDTQMRELMALN